MATGLQPLRMLKLQLLHYWCARAAKEDSGSVAAEAGKEAVSDGAEAGDRDEQRHLDTTADGKV
eukprot:CAMPEP_0172190976 /NCGR_PEP_ID=MMETSP1050-20130122/23421_1 /TAXON_ID=233186 /ORGANISM="Cryptomonas curvata, Strain CCAP979/52" /LENGTH=63 /DNA_ID=CAMNT_0012865927 /DNA_START=643 /DNA_END=831 /DNA_ORIENTATION=-